MHTQPETGTLTKNYDYMHFIVLKKATDRCSFDFAHPYSLKMLEHLYKQNLPPNPKVLPSSLTWSRHTFRKDPYLHVFVNQKTSEITI